jgi:hypothetical protein
MKKLTKIWFEDLFREELADVEANIENNKIWAYAATSEEAQHFEYTIEALEEYKATLEEFQKAIMEAVMEA